MKKLVLFGLLGVLLCTSTVFGFADVLNITLYEYATEAVASNGTGERMWDEYNNRSWSNLTLWELNVTGKVNITCVSSEIISSINVSLSNTSKLNSVPTLNSSPSYSQVGIQGSVGSTVYVYITELHPGDSVILDYDVDDSQIPEPLNITETYDKQEAITGGDVNITINITNQHFATIQGINVTKRAYGYENTSGGTNYFNFSKLGGPDSVNASIDASSDPNILTWAPAGGTLTPGESQRIYFTATVPKNLNLSAAGRGIWLNVGNITINFTALYSISGLKVDNVTGVGMASISVGKERVNETHWKVWPQFNATSSEIDYNLTRASVWATEYQDYNPGNTSLTDSNRTWVLDLRVPNGTGWENITGAAFPYAQVPVVWGTVNFTIWDNDTTGDTGQIDRYHRTYQGSDGYLYLEDLFVLVGYMVKVTKHVIPSGVDNQYNVSIVLENIGNSSTPSLVIVYDLIPPKFNLSNTSNSVAGDEGEINVTPSALLLGITDNGVVPTGSYVDYWSYHVSLSSLSPDSNGDGIYDGAPANSEVLISYQMNGTGLYHVENAFIVGVDPIRVEGAHASKNIESSFGALSDKSTPETLVMVIVLIANVALLLALRTERPKKAAEKKN